MVLHSRPPLSNASTEIMQAPSAEDLQRMQRERLHAIAERDRGGGAQPRALTLRKKKRREKFKGCICNGSWSQLFPFFFPPAARKSSGGKAPRKALATKAARKSAPSVGKSGTCRSPSRRNSLDASMAGARRASISPAPARRWPRTFSKWLLTVPTDLIRIVAPEQGLGGVQEWSVVALTGPRATVPPLDVIRSEDEFIDAILEHCQRCADNTCKFYGFKSESMTSKIGDAVAVAIPPLGDKFGRKWQELKWMAAGEVNEIQNETIEMVETPGKPSKKRAADDDCKTSVAEPTKAPTSEKRHKSQPKAEVFIFVNYSNINAGAKDELFCKVRKPDADWMFKNIQEHYKVPATDVNAMLKMKTAYEDPKMNSIFIMNWVRILFPSSYVFLNFILLYMYINNIVFHYD